MGVTVRFVKNAWCIFIHHKGRRKSRRIGSSEAAARRVAAALEEQLARSDFGLAMRDGSETVQVFADRWLPAAGLKASTQRFYGATLKRYVYPVVGSVALAAVRRHHVKALIITMNAQKLRPKTILGAVRTLSTVLSEAVEDGLVESNAALRPGRLRRRIEDPNAFKAPSVDPYTRDEVRALVATALSSYPEWAAFILCAARTGLRLGELRALQWCDIHWQQRFITVQRNFVEGAYTTPKSGLSRRVDMSRQLRAALRLWRQRVRQEAERRRGSMPDLVFPPMGRHALRGARGTFALADDTSATLDRGWVPPPSQPIDDSRIRKALREIAAAANVRPRRQIVHVFRHTFCSLLVQEGESLVYVKDQAGHSSVNVTGDFYSRFAPGRNREAVDRLDEPRRARARMLRPTLTRDGRSTPSPDRVFSSTATVEDC